MNPVSFPAVTHLLGAPETWDTKAQGECQPLPVERLPHGWRSLWRPSPLDLKILAAGGAVELVIYGHSHPPVALDTVASREVPLPRQPLLRGCRYPGDCRCAGRGLYPEPDRCPLETPP